MMTYEDEIIAEQYFPYNHMSISNRNFFINLLMSTKELQESEFKLRSDDPISYKLVFLTLNNDNGIVKFDGAITNGVENRIIYGMIYKKLNKFFVNSSIIRCNEYVDEDDKEYTFSDEFCFKGGHVIRKTRYSFTKEYFESEINLYSDEEIENFIQGRVDEFRRR